MNLERLNTFECQRCTDHIWIIAI